MLEMKRSVSEFQGFSFIFVRREVNKAAHALNIVYDTNPGFLIDVVQSDRLVSY